MISSELYNTLTVSDKVWLTNLAISRLSRLGFSAVQRNDIKLHKVLTITGTMPRWDLLDIEEAVVVEALRTYPKFKSDINSTLINTHYYNTIRAALNLPLLVVELVEDELIEEPTPNPISYIYKSECNGVVTEETEHDLNVKYQECYGKKDGDVIYIERATLRSNGINIQYRHISDEYLGDLRTALYDSSFDFTLPKLGFINVDDYVIFIERKHKKHSPSRYRKALRQDTLLFIPVCYYDLKALNKKCLAYLINDDSRMFNKLAPYVFFPKEYSYEEAISSIISRTRLATAFSSSFCIKLDFLTDKILLLRYDLVIGVFDEAEGYWKMMTSLFNDDLIELGVKVCKT